jgi:hypothetical protein
VYNIVIAIAAAILGFLLITAVFGWKVAVIPALLLGVSAFLLLTRRTASLVEPEMAKAVALLQSNQIDAGRAALQAMKVKYGKWQLLLEGQLDAQMGMLDYLHMKWDEAYPLLDRGKWRNWTALVCLACIHWRRGEREKAWPLFESAADAAPKETMVYVVWATLLTKAEQRDQALKALDRGLKENTESAVLKELHATIANKRKIDTKSFPQAWYQFFPEDLVQQHMIKGRRDQPPSFAPANTPLGDAPKPNRKTRRSKGPGPGG